MSQAGRPSERLREADAEARRVAARAEKAVQEWEAENLAARGACDFCARLLKHETEPTTVWETESDIVLQTSVMNMDTLGAASFPHGFDPEWIACSVCDKVVEQGDAATLADHVLATRDPRVGPLPDDLTAEVRNGLLVLYEAFYARNPRRQS